MGVGFSLVASGGVMRMRAMLLKFRAGGGVRVRAVRRREGRLSRRLVTRSGRARPLRGRRSPHAGFLFVVTQLAIHFETARVRRHARDGARRRGRRLGRSRALTPAAPLALPFAQCFEAR